MNKMGPFRVWGRVRLNEPLSLSFTRVEFPAESGAHPARGWGRNDIGEVVEIEQDAILVNMDPSMKVGLGAPLIRVPRDMWWLFESL